MIDVAVADNRAVVEELDKQANNGKFDGNTAYLAWSVWRWICRQSSNSKIAALRVRSDDPSLGVLPPDRGGKKSRQWLYPEELAQLLACEDVPVRWRRIFVLTVYMAL